MKRIALKTSKRRTELKSPARKGEAILVSGFGDVVGQVVIGTLQRINRHHIVLEIKDGKETYEETYNRKTGIRLMDEGEDHGWRINLDELVEQPDLVQDSQTRSDSLERVKLLHRETHPDGEEYNIVVEVWYDNILDQRYGKFYRQSTNGGKHRCFLVPFQLMKRIIADQEVQWDV